MSRLISPASAPSKGSHAEERRRSLTVQCRATHTVQRGALHDAPAVRRLATAGDQLLVRCSHVPLGIEGDSAHDLLTDAAQARRGALPGNPGAHVTSIGAGLTVAASGVTPSQRPLTGRGAKGTRTPDLLVAKVAPEGRLRALLARFSVHCVHPDHDHDVAGHTWGTRPHRWLVPRRKALWQPDPASSSSG